MKEVMLVAIFFLVLALVIEVRRIRIHLEGAHDIERAVKELISDNT